MLRNLIRGKQRGIASGQPRIVCLANPGGTETQDLSLVPPANRGRRIFTPPAAGSSLRAGFVLYQVPSRGDRARRASRRACPRGDLGVDVDRCAELQSRQGLYRLFLVAFVK